MKAQVLQAKRKDVIGAQYWNDEENVVWLYIPELKLAVSQFGRILTKEMDGEPADIFSVIEEVEVSAEFVVLVQTCILYTMLWRTISNKTLIYIN